VGGIPACSPGHLQGIRRLMASRQENEFLAAVGSDLAFLRDDWDESVEEQSLRRSSNVLRNLLVEDGLGRAWRMVGQPKEPEVEAIDLSHILAGLRFDKILLAAAGGGTAGGAMVAGALISSKVLARTRGKPWRLAKSPRGRSTGSLSSSLLSRSSLRAKASGEETSSSTSPTNSGVLTSIRHGRRTSTRSGSSMPR
jgi:hypothetical protein